MADEEQVEKEKPILFIRDDDNWLYEDRDRDLHKKYGPAAVQAYVNRFVDKGNLVKVAWKQMDGWRELEGIEDLIEAEDQLEEETKINTLIIREIGYGFPHHEGREESEAEEE